MSGRIGDTLFVTSIIGPVKKSYPKAKISMLTHKNTMDLLKNNPDIDDLGNISNKRARMKGWFSLKKSYDLTLVFNYVENMIPIINYALRVSKIVISFEQGDVTTNKKLYRSIKKPKENIHVLYPYENLVNAAGVSVTKKRIFYFPTNSEKNKALIFLKENNIKRDNFIIGLKCSGLPSRKWRDWPIYRFIELSRKIILKKSNVKFIIFGAGNEINDLTELKNAIGNEYGVIAYNLPIRLVGAIMSNIDMFIGVSTGPAHLMSSYDIPSVTLWHQDTPSSIGKPLDHPFSSVIDQNVKLNSKKRQSLANVSSDKVFSKVKKYL